MIEEPTKPEVAWNYPKLARVVWALFILSFVGGLVMQLGGLKLVYRDVGGPYLWWSGLTIVDIFEVLTYFILTPVTLIVLSVYLVLIRNDVGIIAVGTSILVFISGVSWGMHFILHRMAYDLLDVAYAIMYWSTAMVFLGITFFLMGNIYLKKVPTTLTRLTGISFLVVGFIGIIVGYIGGFTLLPWFTIYDFPWVTTAAILPCCLALIQIVNER